MDLNKAMVEMYKRRSSSGNKHRTRTSPNSVKQENNKKIDQPTVELDVDSNKPIEKKLIKIEEFDACVPNTTFDQLYDCEKARDQLVKILDNFQSEINDNADRTFDEPILICGSKGLGKTSLVEAAANYAKLKMIRIPLVRLARQTRNRFEESIKQLVRYSMNNQPAIVLIDNMEKIIDKEEFRDIIDDAITELLDPKLKLLIFCTTSSNLDPGWDVQFLREIELRRPSLDGRYKILKSLREIDKGLNCLTDENLTHLAVSTPSFTAIHLRRMLRNAKIDSQGLATLETCLKAAEPVRQSFKKGTHLISETPSVTMDDIGGLEEVKRNYAEILRETKESGGKFAGIALHGPPGCGKTMLAKAMANQGGFNFISIDPGQMFNKFLGETEKNIRRVFQEAREYEPCMIYFDEFDGLCGTRGKKEKLTSAIETLLSEMDGFVNRGQSIILASTNRLEDIDPAMKRPGRLSHHIYVGPPNEESRRKILKIVTSKDPISMADDVDIDCWARETEGFTGADLDFLVAEAKRKARRDDGVSLRDNKILLRREHFVFGLEKIRSTKQESDKKIRSSKRAKIDPDGVNINCNCNCHLYNNN